MKDARIAAARWEEDPFTVKEMLQAMCDSPACTCSSFKSAPLLIELAAVTAQPHIQKPAAQNQIVLFSGECGISG